ncbi:MAG: hypothetical protein JW889_03870 [Verrucomicrobia bacterium]|nr:hypothetical protein [Verrucomicrobiota bacterium]
MHILATKAIQFAVLWAMCAAIVWISVRLVGRRLKPLDAASVALLGSALSLGARFIPIVGVFSGFVFFTVLLLLACGLSPWRAAVSSFVVQILAFIALKLIH